MGGLMASCEDKTPIDNEDEAQKHEEIINQQLSDVDQVKTTYNGEVALIDVSSENLMPYFQKRMSNTTADITEHTDVVLLSEQGASRALNNDDFFNKLQNHWKKNKAIGVLYPSEKSEHLFAKLRGQEYTQTDNYDDGEKEKVAIYMASAVGGSITYMDPTTQRSFDEIAVVTEENEEIINELRNAIVDEEETNDFVPESTWGQIAEQTTKWMNESAENASSFNAMLRSVSTAPEALKYQNKFCRTYTINHSILISRGEYGSLPSGYNTTSTVTATTEVFVSAAYSEDNNGTDLYDISLTQRVDGSECYYKNIITKTVDAGLWEYKYKYSGACYYYPEIKLEISGLDGNRTNAYCPVPLIQAGSYNTMHDPGTITLSGGLSGGVSTSGPQAGINLGGSVSLPKTTVTSVHQEMPVNYSEGNTWVAWKYSQDKRIYKDMYGFNADYLGPNDIALTDCKTQQAVTFVAENTKNLGTKSINLKITHKSCFYEEAAKPTAWGWRKSYFTSYYNLTLPKVNRFFERYVPSRYASTSAGDAADWTNLENMLKGNVNYKILLNEEIKIGAQTVDGVSKNAEDIWAETVESLVKQYNGNPVNNEYVIGYVDSDGDYLKTGLHIKGNTWELVDDITKVDLRN